jgi:hypothetical protein
MSSKQTTHVETFWDYDPSKEEGKTQSGEEDNNPDIRR